MTTQKLSSKAKWRKKTTLHIAKRLKVSAFVSLTKVSGTSNFRGTKIGRDRGAYRIFCEWCFFKKRLLGFGDFVQRGIEAKEYFWWVSRGAVNRIVWLVLRCYFHPSISVSPPPPPMVGAEWKLLKSRYPRLQETAPLRAKWGLLRKCYWTFLKNPSLLLRLIRHFEVFVQRSPLPQYTNTTRTIRHKRVIRGRGIWEAKSQLRSKKIVKSHPISQGKQHWKTKKHFKNRLNWKTKAKSRKSRYHFKWY